MSKPSVNALQAVLDRASREEAAETPAPMPAKPAPRTKGREGTVLVGAHFPPDVLKQLRMIAAEEGTTNQALLAEALEMLFRHRGKRVVR